LQKAVTNSREIAGPAVEFWRQILLRIPTQFGRLTYIASLRDSITGRYSESGLRRSLDMDDTNRALAHCHYRAFSQWISSSLKDQKADLEEYLLRCGDGWEQLEGFRQLVPPTAREVECQLYLTDLETLLELLRV